MTTPFERALSLLRSQVGREEGCGAWHTIDQRQIDAFADATLDHQFIHVDPVEAALRSPYKVPVAHGFLTLSLLPHLVGTALLEAPTAAAREGASISINYGLDRVRFPAPVRVGSRVRARCVLLSVEPVSANTLQLKRRITFEIEGEDKPGCVAEALVRSIYG